MTLRSDHVAGGVFVVFGLVVLALSGNLPFGTLSFPGAGMMPKLVVGLMVVFGLILIGRAAESPPLATINWSDLPHAVRVTAVAALAVALYTTLGFLITMALLLFSLLFVVERKNVIRAAIFSVGITALAYLLFAMLLKAPLPRGIIGF